MRIALCTRNAGNPVIVLLERTLTRRGATAAIIDDPRQVITDQDWDAGFWRPDSATSEIAAFARQAPHILEGVGVPFLNSLASMERAASKVVSLALFRRAGLDVPPTIVAPTGPPPDGPVIVKPIWGKKARAVRRYDNAAAGLAAAGGYGEPTIVQTAICWRYQYRCVVDRGGLVRVYRDRNADPHDVAIRTFDRFNPNHLEDPPVSLEAIAGRMLDAVDGDLMRADVLEDSDGRLWALEINASFGFPHDDQQVLDAFVNGFERVSGQGADERPTW